jgi:hypothetical protein
MMDLTGILIVVVTWGLIARWRDDRRRVVWLATQLRRHPIERLMERLATAYLRILADADPQRRQQAWAGLASDEAALADAVVAWAREMAEVAPPQARIRRYGVPGLDKLWPWAAIDLRKLLAVHAHGLRDAVDNARGLGPAARARGVLAELYLLQHTCHWFCRSRAVATARLLARHQTPYADVLATVSPETRRAYQALTGA